MDVHIGGTPVYSTLGWFDDPILNTFVNYREEDLADLIFHELVHHHLFVKGDTTFNETLPLLLHKLSHRMGQAQQKPQALKDYWLGAKRSTW